LTYVDYLQIRGLFSRACTSGRRPWKLEKRYIEDLEECLNDALIDQLFQLDHLLRGKVDTVEVHKIVNPLTYENPNDVTESYHFRPYAFVKCSKFYCDKLLEASEDGIYFNDSKLRLAISKGILSDHLNNISDEIISNSKKKKSVGLHPLAVASSYLLQDINSELKSYTGTDFGRQKEFVNKIVDAQGT
jgi:hypothetical protein